MALAEASSEYLRVVGIGGARALAAEAVPYVLHELYGGRSSVTARQSADGTDGVPAARPTKKQKRAMKVHIRAGGTWEQWHRSEHDRLVWVITYGRVSGHHCHQLGC